MKKNNKFLILNHLLTREKITRKELAEILNISKMGVTKLTRILLENRLIIETTLNKNNKVGKNAKYLEINTEIFSNILVIYFGLEFVYFYIADIKNNLKHSDCIIINEKIDILDSTIKKTNKILKDYETMLISIGMNGIVDSSNGVSKISTYYHWKNLNLKKIFEDTFNITTIIENGVNLIALSQDNFSNKNKIILNIENGVGATLIRFNKESNDILLEQKEIGHIPFDFSEKSLLCVCGNKGCLDTILSNWRIQERINLKYNINLTYKEIIFKANKNESFFRREINLLLPPLLSAILWVETLLNIDEIIITGEIASLDNFFWKELNRMLKSNSLLKDKNHIIKPLYQNQNLILKGAIKYAIANIVNSQFFKGIYRGV